LGAKNVLATFIITIMMILVGREKGSERVEKGGLPRSLKTRPNGIGWGKLGGSTKLRKSQALDPKRISLPGPREIRGSASEDGTNSRTG
jgi:hypothetical protein